MEEYHQLHYMKSVNIPAHPRSISRSFFLPHHGVWRESSSTTKLRVVFIGSRRSSRGISLNECLYAGPKLQLNISDVLLQWRLHFIVFSVDVEKMCRQIIVHQDDQDLQLILWRESQNEPVQVFRLSTVTYGLTCAPFLALRTVQQLGLDEGDRFPLAAEVIKNGTYVDDVLSGVGNLEDAIELHNQLRGLFMAGGLPLKKWNSNSHELMQRIP
ncbi:uncharacterized protein LOC117177558 [Belonocnema kinseyi]|uniref:uncharacterized protein LOC117177558 n=1 Tax=Belonocnema kinseyi TaxID=2817044 RepID=UPI00143CC5EA|nr:uncharacterized protein LOC117177558 [Belonocnema kinseyi]